MNLLIDCYAFKRSIVLFVSYGKIKTNKLNKKT